MSKDKEKVLIIEIFIKTVRLLDKLNADECRRVIMTCIELFDIDMDNK